MPNKGLDAAIKWFHRSTRTGQFVSREFVEDSLVNMIFQIRERTKNGIDVNGNSFAPYSPAYEEFKGSDHVDLTLTGQMLDSLDYRVSANKAVIFFSDPESEEKAFKLNYGFEESYFSVPPREFIGVNDAEINFFIEELADGIHEQFDN